MVPAIGGLQINRPIQNVQLGEVVNQIFKCLVCFSIVRSPVSIGNCCKQVLGCGNCFEQWFVNNTFCPHCREDIGIEDKNKLVISVFDEFLDRCRVLFDNQSSIGFRSIFNFLMDPHFRNLSLPVGRVLRKSPMNLGLSVRWYVYFYLNIYSKKTSRKQLQNLVCLQPTQTGSVQVTQFFFLRNFYKISLLFINFFLGSVMFTDRFGSSFSFIERNCKLMNCF